ncbi:MAG: hypothetical protein QOE23_1629, partial [Pseudonocardiales bacterium]|nr:hypothetical protein [Pseudonocardiales bacterium]
FGVVVLQSWKARKQADLWVHATLFVAFATFFYYGYDGIQLTVAMAAAALALRTRRGEVEAAGGRLPPVRPALRARAAEPVA